MLHHARCGQLFWLCGSHQSTGGLLFSSAGQYGPLFVFGGPDSCQICQFKAKNGGFAGRMWPAGRMFPPPALEASQVSAGQYMYSNRLKQGLCSMYSLQNNPIFKVAADSLLIFKEFLNQSSYKDNFYNHVSSRIQQNWHMLRVLKCMKMTFAVASHLIMCISYAPIKITLNITRGPH